MFVKICGCRTELAVLTAVEAGANAVGFVLVPGQRRYVAPEAVRRLTRLIPDGVWRVGVFLDQPPAEVAQAAAEAGCDTVQLHGSEPPADARTLGGRFRVVKAWRGIGHPPVWADHVLAEPAAGRPGGTGATWDWAQVRGLPVILAGGLDAGNVAQALELALPFGVDVSSGVETEGVKDPEKIRAFCAAVRRWELEHTRTPA